MVSVALRVFGWVLTALLVVAIPVAGAAVVAQPGEPAWRITRAVDPDYARVVERAQLGELAHRAASEAATAAVVAIRGGDLDRARRELDRLRAQLPLITGDEQAAGWRLHELLSADLTAAQTTHTTTGVQR